MRVLVLFLFLLTSCGQESYEDPRKYTGSHADFKKYIENFQDSIGGDVSHIPINYEEMVETKAGTCRRYADGNAEISINEEYWKNSMNEDQKYNLIYHELGHCYLNLPHNVVLFNDGCPGSFMYNQVSSKSCLDDHWEELMEEMF